MTDRLLDAIRLFTVSTVQTLHEVHSNTSKKPDYMILPILKKINGMELEKNNKFTNNSARAGKL